MKSAITLFFSMTGKVQVRSKVIETTIRGLFFNLVIYYGFWLQIGQNPYLFHRFGSNLMTSLRCCFNYIITKVFSQTYHQIILLEAKTC